MNCAVHKTAKAAQRLAFGITKCAVVVFIVLFFLQNYRAQPRSSLHYTGIDL
jgi:low affinity Fe/Cu permease